ncbi:MAG TPA: 2,3-bisphosphoglycerate-independent phosphoglycerate mutase [Blastocatellia bacterium]|nr:2,3-bisphosphoglycerate-independent phosphoglycerate mutase [Blastocatellia bacterium]
MTQVKNTPLVLIVLDGFGYSADRVGNAIALARTPHFDEWYQNHPYTLIEASGQYVGLRSRQMGNSEVGHLNIGAGRIVRMDTSRIDHAIETGEFFRNEALLAAIAQALTHNSSLHLIGLVSHGGVHSSQEHLYALLRMAKEHNVERVFVHAFLDGRDTAPDSGAGYVAELCDRMKEHKIGRVASVVGRYYAMDRDKRWERTEQAYRLLRYGEGRPRRDPVAAISESYSEGVTDEFVKPIVCIDDQGAPIASIRDGDSVVFFNFRSDRARQITRTFTEAGFNFFDRGTPPSVRFTCMTHYDRQFNLPVAFGPEHHEQILANVFAQAGLKNLRIAETEKYAHVTFFFNGGVEPPFEGEERILIPSPKVATYDLKPEMSAYGITDEVVAQIGSGRFDVVIMNYANADMVGHTGNLESTIKAIEAIDECLGRVVAATREKGGSVIITADHGNAEQMIDPETGQIFTAHTTNPVPVILINGHRGKLRETGSLRDIAPTMLGILGLKQPAQMSGQDLRLEKDDNGR